MNICAIIPSYNESQTIGKLIQRIKAQGLDVIVVDDGSSDDTAQIAKEAGAEVIRHVQNKGKGSSLTSGFDYVLRHDYDAVITMDGDGQHSPDDIAHLINIMETTNADIVVGNRMFSTKNMPTLRWLTNKTMSFLISAICRKDIPDSQCGFRLFKKNVLRNLHLKSHNYEIETETLIEASRQGFQIRSVPIQTIYSKQTSNINPFIDTIRFLRYLLRLCFFFLFRRK